MSPRADYDDIPGTYVGCYARLAERFPGDGGEIRYVGETLGPVGGLAVGWLLAFCYTGIVAFHCVMVAWLVDISVSSLGGAFGLTAGLTGVIDSTALMFGIIPGMCRRFADAPRRTTTRRYSQGEGGHCWIDGPRRSGVYYGYRALRGDRCGRASGESPRGSRLAPGACTARNAALAGDEALDRLPRSSLIGARLPGGIPYDTIFGKESNRRTS